MNLGNVSVSFNASDITLNSREGCNELSLIVSSSLIFNTRITSYPLVLDRIGVYTVIGVNYDNKDYFKMECKDQIFWDGASTYYDGSGTANVPAEMDACLKFLVKSGKATLVNNGYVRELEAGGVLEITSGVILTVTKGIKKQWYYKSESWRASYSKLYRDLKSI